MTEIVKSDSQIKKKKHQLSKNCVFVNKKKKMEIFDVNKMCRICLEENELISVFELSIDPPLFQMILSIANVQVRFLFKYKTTTTKTKIFPLIISDF